MGILHFPRQKRHSGKWRFTGRQSEAKQQSSVHGTDVDVDVAAGKLKTENVGRRLDFRTFQKREEVRVSVREEVFERSCVCV